MTLRHPFALERKDNLDSCSDDDHHETSRQTNDTVASVALESIAVVVAKLNCVEGDAVDQD